jgi:pimeloyl-ACP methyl ester carboxylesterase
VRWTSRPDGADSGLSGGPSTEPRPTLVLVHAAWHGAWCWSALTAALRRRGVDTRAVELTSHGTDPADVGDLRSDTELVREAVRAVPGPVVLLGHSYGGVVVTEAAEGLDNVSRLVYLAAFAPDKGDTMLSLTGGGDAPWIHAEDGLLSVEPGWGRRLFYSGCGPRTALDAERRLLPQSAASFAQEVRRTAWRSIPSTYVVCSEDRAIPPGAQRRMGAAVGEVVELKAGHSPFLSDPSAVADLLDTLV